METCLTLYSPFAAKDSGKLLHQCQAIKHQDGENEQVHMALFERCMVQSGSKGNKTIPFDFELRYSFMNNPPSIILDKIEEKVAYFLHSEADLKKLREILSQKINQLGFHEQFHGLKRIGRGTLASHHLVQKFQDGKKYAVKAFSKGRLYNQDQGKERLIKQIQIMRTLSHNNLTKLFEVFESDNSIYMLMEYLQGIQLADKIKDQKNLGQNRFKPNEIKQIITCILKGLEEMHSKNIMHRNLKPQNLRFRQEGGWDCVITSLGIAEFSNEQEYLFVRCGTPGYMAPQVINITDISARYAPICDMFSLGIIFHILLLGVSPFKGATLAEIRIQNRASNFTFQGEEYHSLDPRAFDLLVRMLKIDPIERISAAEALRHPYFAQVTLGTTAPSFSMKQQNIQEPYGMADKSEEKAIKKVQLKMEEQKVINEEEAIVGNNIEEKCEDGASSEDSSTNSK